MNRRLNKTALIALTFCCAMPAWAQTPTPTPTLRRVTISGTIFYCINRSPDSVPGVTLTLTGSESGSTVSDGSGNYSFTVSAGGSYTVTPTKAAFMPGSVGIDTVDVIAILRLRLFPPSTGNPPIPNDCRLTAADVNGIGGINTVDIIATQRFFAGFSNGIANVGKYNFNPASRSYLNVVTDQTGQDHNALIFGDVATPFVQP